MTDEELKELVANLAKSHQENNKEIKALTLSQQKTEELFRENREEIKALTLSQQKTEELFRENREEIKVLTLSQQKTEELFRENREEIKVLTLSQHENREEIKVLTLSQQETKELVKQISKEIREQGKQIKEQSKQIREQGKQIGGLNNKFGSFTEGLVLPSMTKVLKTDLNMECVISRLRVNLNGEELELDLVAYSNNGVQAVYVVEVKSVLNDQAIEQILKILKKFFRFFPEHKHKKLYGILAFVDYKKDSRKKAIEEGLYLATIHDEVFQFTLPKGFQPKNFNMNSSH